MKPAQWTVIGLLVALLGLEAVRSPNVKSFFTNAYASFQGALGNAVPPAASTGGDTSSGATCNSNASCAKVSSNTQPSSYPASLPDSIRNTHGKNTIG